MEIVKDLRILKVLEKLSNNEWKFDREYKYHIGETYVKTNAICYKDRIYKLKYVSGCFYPYCVREF